MTASSAAAAPPNSGASACAIAARLQTMMNTVNPVFAPSRSMMRPASSSPTA
jgi:hypothetical protein